MFDLFIALKWADNLSINHSTSIKVIIRDSRITHQPSNVCLSSVGYRIDVLSLPELIVMIAWLCSHS